MMDVLIYYFAILEAVRCLETSAAKQGGRKKMDLIGHQTLVHRLAFYTYCASHWFDLRRLNNS